MADVLTLGQQQLTVLHYQVQQRSVALPRTTCSKLGQQTLYSALQWAKKVCFTPELALLIWYK